MSSYLKTTADLRERWGIEAAKDGDQTVANRIAEAGYRPVSALTVGRWRREASTRIGETASIPERLAGGSNHGLKAATPVGTKSSTNVEQARRLPLTGNRVARAMRSYTQRRQPTRTSQFKVIKKNEKTWLVTDRVEPISEIWIEVNDDLSDIGNGTKFKTENIAENKDNIEHWKHLSESNVKKQENKNQSYSIQDNGFRTSEVWNDHDSVSWGGGSGTLKDLSEIVAEIQNYRSVKRPSWWKQERAGLRNLTIQSDGTIYHTDGYILIERKTPFALKRNNIDYSAFPMPVLKDALRTAKNLYGRNWQRVPMEFGTAEYSSAADKESAIEKTRTQIPSEVLEREHGVECASFIKIGEPGEEIIITASSVDEPNLVYGPEMPNCLEHIEQAKNRNPNLVSRTEKMQVGELQEFIKSSIKKWDTDGQTAVHIEVSVTEDCNAYLSSGTHDSLYNARNQTAEQEKPVESEKMQTTMSNLPSNVSDGNTRYNSIYFHADFLLQAISGLSADNHIELSGLQIELDQESKYSRTSEPWLCTLVSENADASSWNALIMPKKY